MVSDPHKDANACEDFFLLTVTCHILCAAMKIMQMSSLNDFPDGIEDDWNIGTKEGRRKKLYSIASDVISRFLDISVFSGEGNDQSTNQDQIFEYAKEVFSVGLLYMVFQDGIREGNGELVVNVWKYLLILFKATSHKNYALEAFHLLAELEWILPSRQVMQVKFSRFVNTNGRQGCNIPSDLYMEHLNRMVKNCITHLGANKTESSIQRVGKCIGLIDELTESFDNWNNLPTSSMHHPVPISVKDRDQIIQVLQQVDVFTVHAGRQHTNFKNFSCNPMKNVDKKEIELWMKKQFQGVIDAVSLKN